jgi:hypothetical protein
VSTTTRELLRSELPESETEWRDLAAKAHRSRALPGDEAAALTHELAIWEIRRGLLPGTSNEIRFCPRCLRRGVKYMLLEIAGTDRCGTCDWPSPPPFQPPIA